MSYTIRNIRPSVLHIPDAAMRLESGQAVVVAMLTPQMGPLVEAQAIEVVTSDLPTLTPAVAAPQMDVPPPPLDAPVPKRGGKAAPVLPERTETADDHQ